MSHQKKSGLCRLSTDPPHTHLTCQKRGDMPVQYHDKAALRKCPRPPGIDPIEPPDVRPFTYLTTVQEIGRV